MQKKPKTNKNVCKTVNTLEFIVKMKTITFIKVIYCFQDWTTVKLSFPTVYFSI